MKTGSTLPGESGNPARLNWPTLLEGTLIGRYKRFLADVRLNNRRKVTAHCPNSGSMAGCSEAGRRVYLSRQNNPKRKLPYTWEMIKMPSSLVGVNTLIPNRLAAAGVLAGAIPELSGFTRLRTEVRYGENSRIDLLLDQPASLCYVEVKNCTLVEEGVAFFPDAVTSRGKKHLLELQEQVRRGYRAVMFFLIQRTDASTFRPADRIDPAYGKELRKAVGNGVEAIAYDVKLDLEGIELHRPLPVEL